MAAERDELIMLYEQATQDIRTFQDRQASVTNSAALILVALVGFTNLLSSRGWLVVFGIGALTTVTGVAAWVWLTRLQLAMHRARKKAARARRQMSPAFKRAHGSPRPSGYVEQWDTVNIVRLVIIVGVLLTWIVLWGARTSRPGA
jgi:hypothetical protein